MEVSERFHVLPPLTFTAARSEWPSLLGIRTLAEAQAGHVAGWAGSELGF